MRCVFVFLYSLMSCRTNGQIIPKTWLILEDQGVQELEGLLHIFFVFFLEF